MIRPNTAAGTARLTCLMVLISLGCTAGAAEAACTMADIVTELRQASSSYSTLVGQINPRYIPRDLEGYDEAADRLERIGAELELLSRKALQLNSDDADAIAALHTEIQDLHQGMTDLRAFSTPLRAYGYLAQKDVDRPRWAFTQVSAERFVEPDVHAFNADFTDTVEITAAAGDHAAVQLIAIPIAHDIRNPGVDLPQTLEGEDAAIEHLHIRCGQAATRSSPLAEDEREYSNCPYRLRDCNPGHTILKDRLQPYWFVLRVPPETPPGTYRGEMKFFGEDVHDVRLTLQLTIPEADSEATQK